MELNKVFQIPKPSRSSGHPRNLLRTPTHTVTPKPYVGSNPSATAVGGKKALDGDEMATVGSRDDDDDDEDDDDDGDDDDVA